MACSLLLQAPAQMQSLEGAGSGVDCLELRSSAWAGLYQYYSDKVPFRELHALIAGVANLVCYLILQSSALHVRQRLQGVHGGADYHELQVVVIYNNA